MPEKNEKDEYGVCDGEVYYHMDEMMKVFADKAKMKVLLYLDYYFVNPPEERRINVPYRAYYGPHASEIRRATGISPTHLSKILKEMEAEGTVISHRRDAKRVSYYLTEMGFELAKNFSGVMDFLCRKSSSAQDRRKQ